MKKCFKKAISGILSAAMLITSVAVNPLSAAAAPTFTKVGGWNETIYAELSGVKDADVTSVSYSGPTSGTLTGEDLQYLVRNSGSGVRIDIPGLKPGDYTLTVNGTTSNSFNVPAQDRSGYAHFNYTEGVGAYNDDGTLKANAKVLYVTNENKNTVTVTSKDGTTVTGIGHILNSAGKDNGTGTTSKGGKPNNNQGIIGKLADDGTPLVVRIIGNVTAPDGVTAYDSVDYGGSLNDNGFMVRMQGGKDVTIEGLGSDAGINGWGIHFICDTAGYAKGNGKSFEVRNISFTNVPEDCVGMEGQYNDSTLVPVERCWVHNCSFYAPTIANPAESDKDGGDGACDFKRGQYFTNSYCYYEGYHKTNLVGSGDSDAAGPQYHLTYHHNYWKNCDSRGPLARKANIHMYNNVFEGQTSYCMNPRVNSYIFSEYNLFYQCKNPVTVTAGAVKSYNDSFSGCIESNDATIVTDKNQKVSSGCLYENFDTNSSMSYIPSGSYDLQESISDAKAVVFAYAGSQKEDVISPEQVNTSILASDRQPTASVVLPYDKDLNSTTVPSKSGTFDNIIFNVYKNAGPVSLGSTEAGQDIVFNVNTAVNISITDGGATYPVVLLSASGEEIITGTGTATNVPAGTYMIQSSGFQPAKGTTPAKFKEAKISHLKIEAYDASAPTVSEPTTQATTQAVDNTTQSTTQAQGGEETEETTQSTTPVVPAGAKTHNFSTQDKNNDFFTITGDSLASKGTVEYNGATLTKSFKLNSKGTITFTNTATGKLVMVFGVTSEGNIISIDSTQYTVPVSGIVTAPVEAGTHTIARVDGESLLYYMSYADDGSSVDPETTEATTEATTKATEATTEATTETPVIPTPEGIALKVGSAGCAVNSTVKIPVTLTGMKDLADYSIIVGYDKNILTPVSVENGDLISAPTMDYNIEEDVIRIAGINVDNTINADGTVLCYINFNAKTTGTANLIVNIDKLQGSDLADIPPETVGAGTVTVEGETPTPEEKTPVDTIQWTVSNGLVSGDNGNGLTAGEAMTFTAGSKTIGEYTFAGQVQGATNPTITNGVPTSGAYYKFVPEKDGTFTVAYTVGTGKTVSVFGKTNNAAGDYVETFDVTAGQTYYIYGQGTKVVTYYLGYTPKTNTKLGDVNKDGKVDKVDAAIVLRYISGIDAEFDTTKYDIVAADCDGKAGIDILDVIWILNYKETPVDPDETTTTETTTITTETTTTTTTTTTTEATTEATTSAPVVQDQISKFYVNAADATANGDDIANNATSIFTNAATGTGSLSSTATIAVDGKNYTLSKRTGNGAHSLTIVVPSGVTNATLYVYGNSSGASSTRKLTLSGITATGAATGSAGSLSTFTGLNAGTYTLTSDGNWGYSFLALSVSNSGSDNTTEATTEATTKATEATTETTTATTEATTKENTTEATTSAPVVGDGLVAGTYTLNKVNAVTNGIAGINTSNIYSSDSSAVKVRAANYVEIKPAVSGTISIDWSSNAPKVVLVNGTSESDVVTATTSPVVFSVTAGNIYRVYGTKTGGNSNLTQLVLSSGSGETPTEGTTSKTEDTTSKTEEGSTEATTTDLSGAVNIAAGDATSFISAVNNASAGTVINLAAGNYKMTSSTLKLGKTATSAKPITITCSNGYATLDFNSQSSGTRGITASGSYYNLSNVVVKNAGDNGMYVTGSHMNIENCIFQANGDTGLQISGGGNNILVKNCTAFDNLQTENADGFAAKLGAGENVVFDGCIAYCNSDDGWDLFSKSGSEQNKYPITLRNCIAFKNGELTDGTIEASGDRNGFKLGGGGYTGGAHIVENCIAFDNGACGFVDNNNPSLAQLKNCTAYHNAIGEGASSKNNFNVYRATEGLAVTNCLSYVLNPDANGDGKDRFYGSSSGTYYGANATITNSVLGEGNKYYKVTGPTNKKFSANGQISTIGTEVTISDSDFVSLKLPYTDLLKVHEQMRNADGSIKLNGFLQPKAGSVIEGLGATFNN